MRQQPRKRTLLSVTRMSALCHKRTYATQQKISAIRSLRRQSR
jgi:hypothetical protein